MTCRTRMPDSFALSRANYLPGRWLSVCLGLGGELGGVWQEIRYDEIEELDGFIEGAVAWRSPRPNRPPVPNKSRADTLEVCGKHRTLRFRSSPGRNLFALWNICLMLARMTPPDRTPE